jgi:hypothetical protein
VRGVCAAVLVFEGLVVFFATLVALDLSDHGESLVWAVGGAGAVLCVVLAGLLRHQWAYSVASGLQVALVASGLVIPVMFFLGLVFGALWFLALHLGRKVERLDRERARAAAADVPPGGPAPDTETPPRPAGG